MLRGRFDATTSRPLIEGQIIIPRLNIVGYVSFLVDTGADSTHLMQTDGNTLGLDYSSLVEPEQAVGIGGNVKVFKEPAVLAFAEPRTRIYFYAIKLGILEPEPTDRRLLSVLGRDILHRWRMSYNATNKRLFFKVLTADYTQPVPK